jgi:transposase
MMYFDESIQVYVNLGAVDFRRGLDGLLALVEKTFGHVPQERYLFIFRDKSGRKIKALLWDKNGFVLLYKRLEEGKFQFPKNQQGNIELNRLQLECLLSGMSFAATLKKEQQRYSVWS